MEPVVLRDARDPVPTNALVFWTKNTSSIYHLKTPIVKTTSLKSSLLMAWGMYMNVKVCKLSSNTVFHPSHDILPIAMGARLEDYQKVSP